MERCVLWFNDKQTPFSRNMVREFFVVYPRGSVKFGVGLYSYCMWAEILAD